MANREHLGTLMHGVEAWNDWRQDQPAVSPDLSKANLTGANITRADLSGADLSGANLIEADLTKAIFTEAIFTEANLFRADLTGADLTGADLTGAILFGANLIGADLTGAILTGAVLREANLAAANLHEADLRQAFLFGANLRHANLFGANLTVADLKHTLLTGINLRSANLTGCRVYGVSAWDIHLDEHTIQHNLVITQDDEPEVTVDNLEVAQFVYLLLTNEKIRDVIDTIGRKAVLILGRFTGERMIVLEAMREHLRNLDRLPILVNFEAPESQNVVDTVATLGMLVQFVLVDLTDVKSVNQELASILDKRKVPIKPVLLTGADQASGMLKGLLQKHGDCVLPVYHYRDIESLRGAMELKIVATAEARARELRLKEAQELIHEGDVDG